MISIETLDGSDSQVSGEGLVTGGSKGFFRMFHMNILPVIHLDPGGQTAKGRWRAFVTMGRYGSNASWTEGIYEMTYAKENGVRQQFCYRRSNQLGVKKSSRRI